MHALLKFNIASDRFFFFLFREVMFSCWKHQQIPPWNNSSLQLRATSGNSLNKSAWMNLNEWMNEFIFTHTQHGKLVILQCIIRLCVQKRGHPKEAIQSFWQGALSDTDMPNTTDIKHYKHYKTTHYRHITNKHSQYSMQLLLWKRK